MGDSKMRIGIDIDGVIANFYSAYETAVIEEAGGEDKFPAKYPEQLPPVWDWPEHYGYDKMITGRVWKKIKESRSFWGNLGKLPDAKVLDQSMPWAIHDVYFITNRAGANAKQQTERWLRERFPIHNPTVLVTPNKGLAAAALQLDVYIDDKGENVLAVEQQSPATRVYLIDRPYNEHVKVQRRVSGLKSVFELEKI